MPTPPPWKRNSVTEWLFSTLQAIWLKTKRLLEGLLGAKRVDRILELSRFYEIKSRLVHFSMTLPDGNRITYRPYDKRIIEEVYEGGYREVVLRPGDSVIDVGANIGSFTLLAARRVGPSGRVVSVEPDPENARLVQKNIRDNRFSHVSFLRAAVADEAGVMKLYRSGDPALHSLLPTHSSRSIDVPVETLDAIADRHGLGRLALVKIDVEGAEAKVLMGGANTLARTDQIILETGPKEVAEVRDWLDRLGFDIRVARDNGYIIYAVARRKALS